MPILYGDNYILPESGSNSSSLFVSNSFSVVGSSSFIGSTTMNGSVIVNGSISTGGGASVGTGSSAEGFNTTASGDYSHTEGDTTKTGLKGYTGSFFVPGVMTLNSSYGDVSAEFLGTSLVLDDSNYDNNYGRVYLAISSITYVAPSTEITFTDPTITTTTAIIGDPLAPDPSGSDVIFGGYASHAEGKITITVGNYSHAEGDTTQAIGRYSHTEGSNTIAIGLGSHAEGATTQALGNYSHAEGDNTIALGEYQHVQGRFNQTSSAQAAFIIGNGTGAGSESNLVFASGSTFQISGSLIVSGAAQSSGSGHILTYNTSSGLFTYTASSAIGGGSGTPGGSDTQIQYNSASVFDGDSAFTFNYLSQSLQQGNSVLASGIFSHAEGNQTTASNSYAHAEGQLTQATGVYSHAEGNYTVASGQSSHTEGDSTLASGPSAHAEGYVTTASGQYSHAEGYQTQTTLNAAHSHAEGSGSITVGVASHAGGDNTIASGSFQTVYGSYNLQNNTSSKFVVGIGNSGTRKDGFTVDADVNLSGSIMIPTNTGNPSSPKTGSMYFNPSTNLLYIYNGTAWRSSSFS